MNIERFSRLFGVFFVCLCVVSGCKGTEDDNMVRDLPFVVYYDNAESRFLLRSIKLTSENKADLILYAADIATDSKTEEGLCGIGDFQINFDTQINSKYYEATTLAWREAPLSKFTMVEDPSNVQSDSLTLSWSKGSSFIGHTLFLKLSHQTMAGAEYNYWMNYDAELSPPVGNTFTMDLNAVMSQQNTGTTFVPQTIGLTFDMEDFFVKYADRDTFSFTIKYVSGLGEGLVNKYDNYSLPVQLITNPVAKP